MVYTAVRQLMALPLLPAEHISTTQVIKVHKSINQSTLLTRATWPIWKNTTNT